eukprot:1008193-Rhodomonas_salina.1
MKLGADTPDGIEQALRAGSTLPILLRDVRYWHSAMRLPGLMLEPNNAIGYPIPLRACYAKSGTDLAYSAPLSAYARAMRSPVLTSRGVPQPTHLRQAPTPQVVAR